MNTSDMLASDMVQVPKELLREARDNCEASIAETGISIHRKEYRIDLHKRLKAAFTDGVAPTPAPSNDAMQWAVKTLRFLLLKDGGEPVGPHAEFEKAVAAFGVAACEPCPRGDDKPEPSCTNRHQCWEPCGELGNDARHVRVGREDAAAINKALGVTPCDGGQKR